MTYLPPTGNPPTTQHSVTRLEIKFEKTMQVRNENTGIFGESLMATSSSNSELSHPAGSEASDSASVTTTVGHRSDG